MAETKTTRRGLLSATSRKESNRLRVNTTTDSISTKINQTLIKITTATVARRLNCKINWSRFWWWNLESFQPEEEAKKMVIWEVRDLSVLLITKTLDSVLIVEDSNISLQEAISSSLSTAGGAKKDCNNRITVTLTLSLLKTTVRKVALSEIIRAKFKTMDISKSTGNSNQSIKHSIQQLINSMNNKAHRKILTHHNSRATKPLHNRTLKACIKNKILERNLRACPLATTTKEIRMEIILHYRDPRLKTLGRRNSSKALIKTWGTKQTWEETPTVTRQSTNQCPLKSAVRCKCNRHRLVQVAIESAVGVTDGRTRKKSSLQSITRHLMKTKVAALFNNRINSNNNLKVESKTQYHEEVAWTLKSSVSIQKIKFLEKTITSTDEERMMKCTRVAWSQALSARMTHLKTLANWVQLKLLLENMLTKGVVAVNILKTYATLWRLLNLGLEFLSLRISPHLSKLQVGLLMVSERFRTTAKTTTLV